MSTAIYYFSGTGNSLSIARKLHEGLSDSKLVSIAKCIKASEGLINEEAEAVGFVFPLYFFSLPEIIMQLVERLDLSKTKYIFAIVTRGGGWQGSALRHLNKCLKVHGYSLSAGFYITMPDNYLPMSKIKNDADEINTLLKNADDKLKKIIPMLQTEQHMIEAEFTGILRPLVHGYYLKMLKDVDKDFTVDDSCNSCGLCEKVCQVNNISLDKGRPEWNHKCQFCLACINYCPKTAIQYKNASQNNGRYHHPDAPANVFINAE